MIKRLSSFALALIPSALLAQSSEPLALSTAYWKNPSFIKSFNGSYRINARIEPYVTSEQRAVLVSIQSAMRAGKRTAALQKLSQSPLTQSSAALLYNKGNIQFELGKIKESIKSYQSAIKIYPSFRRAHQNLGMALMREGKTKEAESSLREAVSLGDMSATTLGLLAYCHLERQNYAAALQSYQIALITQPDVIEWKVGIAQCLMELDQVAEAIILLRQAIEAQPEESQYAMLLIDALLRNDSTNEALARLELLREQGKLELGQLSLLAQLYIREDLNHLATPILEKMKQQLTLKTLPSFLNCILNLNRLGQFELVVELTNATQKLALDKDNSQKIHRIRTIADYHLGVEGAVKTLKQIVQSSPLDGEVLLLLANNEQKQNNEEAAAIYFERAAKNESHTYAALLEHGKMLVAQKKFEQAVDKLNNAFKLQPSEPLGKYIKAIEATQESWQ